MFEVINSGYSNSMLQKCDLSLRNKGWCDIDDRMGKKITTIFIFTSILGIKRTYLRGIYYLPNPN